MPQTKNTFGVRKESMPSNIPNDLKYTCPVCGFRLDYPPRDFNICPSCGVEFDADTVEYKIVELRQAWIDRGMEWSSNAIPRPPHYDALGQLQNLESHGTTGYNPERISDVHFKDVHFKLREQWDVLKMRPTNAHTTGKLRRRIA